MIYFEVPKSIWISNIFFLLSSMIFGVIFFNFKVTIKSNNPYLLINASLLFLLLTFLNEAYLDVHRWINVLGLNLNIGLIVAPLLIVQIYKLNSLKLKIIFIMLISTIFLIQPDASQVTAFTLSSIFFLFRDIKNKSIALYIFLISILYIALAWYNLEQLPSVDYVENIVKMTIKVSSLLFIISIFSLIFLLIPFFKFYREDKKSLSFVLGIYFILNLISNILGNFPIMIMGYGISPILGYFIALLFVIK